MSKKRLNISWDRKTSPEDIKPALKRFRHHLKDIGLRDSTIESYVFRLGKYLEFAQNKVPTEETVISFRATLHEKALSISSINNYCFAIKKYHEMLGHQIAFPFIKPKNTIPYFFDESDVAKIFGACRNLKHYAMLQTIFYGSLCASELCHLDDQDLDLKTLSIRVREGKGGKEGLVYITNDCARTLKSYLKIRPQLKINGRFPLFYTDFGRRWDRRSLYRMFITYKKLAGVEKNGGLHVFSRHSPASILIKNGCDIITVKELLRHQDINTTARYLHVADATKREKYEKCLSL
ncbi:MAG: site-specific integrase [Methanotrichaceae archaeon]|nr:site-specific integrase [Methanotrichaceae archaeon]